MNARTVKFEKIADRKYHFATTRFPFDGELQIVDLDVRESINAGSGDFWFAPGTIGVQLAGVSDEFLRVHAASYEDWLSGNTLYWDQKSQTWLTPSQYADALGRRVSTIPSVSYITFSYTGLLVAIVVAILLSLVFAQIRVRQMMKRNERALQIAERNLQLHEENSKVSKEILEVLKQRSS